MKALYFLIILCCLVGTQVVTGSDISWEQNVQVRKLEPSLDNSIMPISSRINLNTADKEQLLKLSGIGPKKADLILAYRSCHGPFKNLTELSKIKGFSKKMVVKIIEKNKDLLWIN